MVNEKIRQQVPVTPRLFPDKNDPQLQQVQPASASVSAGVDGYGGYDGISAWWMSPGFLDDEYVGCVHSISRTCFVLAVFHRHVFTQFHGVGARFVFMDWYSCCVSWTCVHTVFCGLVFMLFHALVFIPCFVGLCSCCVSWTCVHTMFHGPVFMLCFMDLWCAQGNWKLCTNTFSFLLLSEALLHLCVIFLFNTKLVFDTVSGSRFTRRP